MWGVPRGVGVAIQRFLTSMLGFDPSRALLKGVYRHVESRCPIDERLLRPHDKDAAIQLVAMPRLLSIEALEKVEKAIWCQNRQSLRYGKAPWEASVNAMNFSIDRLVRKPTDDHLH